MKYYHSNIKKITRNNNRTKSSLSKINHNLNELKHITYISTQSASQLKLISKNTLKVNFYKEHSVTNISSTRHSFSLL